MLKNRPRGRVHALRQIADTQPYTLKRPSPTYRINPLRATDEDHIPKTVIFVRSQQLRRRVKRLPDRKKTLMQGLLINKRETVRKP